MHVLPTIIDLNAIHLHVCTTLLLSCVWLFVTP